MRRIGLSSSSNSPNPLSPNPLSPNPLSPNNSSSSSLSGNRLERPVPRMSLIALPVSPPINFEPSRVDPPLIAAFAVLSATRRCVLSGFVSQPQPRRASRAASPQPNISGFSSSPSSSSSSPNPLSSSPSSSPSSSGSSSSSSPNALAVDMQPPSRSADALRARTRDGAGSAYVPRDRGRARARVAEDAADLRGGGARGAPAGDRLAARGLSLQRLDGAAHDRRHRADRGTRDAVAAQDPREDRGATDQVRQDAAQRAAIGRGDHGRGGGAGHGLGFELAHLLRRGGGHHLGDGFVLGHRVRRDLVRDFHLARLELTKFQLAFELAFAFELQLAFELLLFYQLAGNAAEDAAVRTADGLRDPRP